MNEYQNRADSADASSSNPLTAEEKVELLKCEKALRMLRDGNVEAADALLRIRDLRLYRGSFRTFRDYCRHGCQVGPGYAYDLIKFALIRKELSASADAGTLPMYEAQTRPLAALSAEDRATVWRMALEAAQGEHITGKIVRRAREEFRVATFDDRPDERRELHETLTSAQPEAIKCSDRTITLAVQVSRETLQTLERLAKENAATLKQVVSQVLRNGRLKKTLFQGIDPKTCQLLLRYREKGIPERKLNASRQHRSYFQCKRFGHLVLKMNNFFRFTLKKRILETGRSSRVRNPSTQCAESSLIKSCLKEC